jgi:ribonuclease HII
MFNIFFCDAASIISQILMKKQPFHISPSLRTCYQPGIAEAGCDEAGRGCLAGPVAAAAVVLPPDFHHPLLNDSKQLSERDRALLRPIIEKEAIAWQVSFVDAKEIDRINILKASFRAMHLAIEQLQKVPELLLIDGNRFAPYFGIPHQCIIKGDSKFASIAAASVLAKTHRDEYMDKLHEMHPEYNWRENKGYPTPFHKSKIKEIGYSPYHRLTFKVR